MRGPDWGMSLMPGMRVVAAFPRRFAADLAIAQLESAGIEAVVLSDTNPETGDAALGASGFRIAVRHEIADDALTVLAGDGRAPSPSADGLDVGSGPRRFGDRPAWIRWATIAALAAMAGPPLIAALFQLEWLIDGLFP